MLRTVITASFAIALVLGGGLLWAQQADSEPPPSESSPTESAPTKMAPMGKDPVGAVSDRDSSPTDSAPTVGARSAGDSSPTNTGRDPQSAQDDPFDYEASEQISEDLSVSFPVDI